MEEADNKKDGQISYEEFLQVLSSEHRRTVTHFYHESEQLSVVSEEEAEEARAAHMVLEQNCLLDSIKESFHILNSVK